MSQFYVVNESTEDTLEASDNLEDAVRMAREIARQGPSGEPVSVLERGGKAVRQFVLMPDGTVAEPSIVCTAKPVPVAPEPNRVEQSATAVRPAG